jgi:hypothetical protein
MDPALVKLGSTSRSRLSLSPAIVETPPNDPMSEWTAADPAQT